MSRKSNMLAETLFDLPLSQYVEAVTSEENLLLKKVQVETRTRTNMINMLSGPVEGQLLQLLVSLSRAKTCLEVGTFTGYSALNIAAALPADGKLITLEYNPEYADIAKKHFALSPHHHKIELLLGNAIDSLKTITTPIDFAFIDADKRNYPQYYELIMDKLTPGGLIVVDNALWGGEVVAPTTAQAQAIDTLNRTAKQDPRVETVMLTVRDGIFIIRKK